MNDELKRVLDWFEHECFMLRVEATETKAKDEAVRDGYERIREKAANEILETLGRSECVDVWGYDPYAAFRCSECGAMHTASDKRVIRFCYNCGRRVKGGAE